MRLIQSICIHLCLALLVNGCIPNRPAPWDGPRLTQPRNQLTVEQLQGDSTLALMDMSFFARPAWAEDASHHFSGSLSFDDTELVFPKERESYPGEDIFPGIDIDFISDGGELIPTQKELIITRYQSRSLWDIAIGTGAVWQEQADGEWSRASFPLTLTDRFIGQSRNCVATFVYKSDDISNVCLQCSQETADLNDRQIGNIQGMLQAQYQPKHFADSAQVIELHQQFKQQRLPVYPLSTIDSEHEVSDYFERPLQTHAPTSLGAVVMDGNIYLHPPKTRHGRYPYPNEMRHGVYSVTKSMAGALTLMYFAERYGEDIVDALITDFVPALADHPGWKGVTFSHTLNMVTGTEGSERLEHLYEIIIKARTAEEAINNVASLGDYPPAPGSTFHYASTNLFVLSYALQHYVREKEGEGIYYWDLVLEHVLKPIGAPYFALMHTVESDGSKGIPLLAYGALPTLDEAAKIALLFSNEGKHKDLQLLHQEKTRELLGRTEWPGHSTNNDYRGMNYQHAFWSTYMKPQSCDIRVTYMLGYGGNYVLLLPSDVVIVRFMDEYDLDMRDLVRRVEKLRSSCQ